MGHLFAICFFFCYAASANVVEGAQNLMASGKRTSAIDLLLKNLDRGKGKNNKDLIEALNEISHVFYSEKGQKLYELAESLSASASSAGTQRYLEAKKFEEGNVLVLLGLARAQIRDNNCDEAAQTLKLAVRYNPYIPEAPPLRLRAFICGAKLEETIAEPNFDKLGKGLKPFGLYVWGRVLLSRKQNIQAKNFLQQAISHDGNFPESYYWLWSANQNSKTDPQRHGTGNEYAQKYLTLCKGLSVEMRRQYKNEPLLCMNLEEVKNALEKSKESEQAGS